MKQVCWRLAFILAILLPFPSRASESAWVINSGGLYTELHALSGWHQTETPQQELAFFSRLEMGFLENASMYLFMPFRSLSTERNNLLLTNNGLTDIHLGTYVQLLSTPIALTLKTGLKIPTGYNPSFLPSIGERQFDAELGLLAGYTPEDMPWFIQAGMGYRWRTPYDNLYPLNMVTIGRKETFKRPADDIRLLLEGACWIVPNILLALEGQGRFALNQTDTFASSQITLNPRLAWRLTPTLDVSLQIEQVLWGQNITSHTAVILGAHFRFNTRLPQGVGLRGGLTVPQ